MQMPTIAILDGDIIAYKLACKVDVYGDEYLLQNIREYVASWTPYECDEVVLAFSCSREDNYRRKYWPDYKAHRSSVSKPDSMIDVINSIKALYKIAYTPHLEADDLMGREASGERAIAVTIDKDLRCTPGWHWNPDKEWEPRYITIEQADRFFYKQWLMGDSTDKIPGVPKVGPVKADRLLEQNSPANWEAIVMVEYEKRGLTEEYALSQATSVRILRDKEEPCLWQTSWMG
jgi:DNA polymerase-1